MTTKKKRKRREPGHISARGEGKYLIRWHDPNGVQVGKVISGDYAAALAELSKCLKPAPKPEPKPVERSFQSYVETEWAQYTADHWKASTQITQGSHVKRHIRPHFDALNPVGDQAQRHCRLPRQHGRKGTLQENTP